MRSAQEKEDKGVIKMTDVSLGYTVRDVVTGFEGMTVAVAKYMYGCTQYKVQPKTKDGNYTEAEWLDEPQLEIVDKGTDIKVLDFEFDFGDEVIDIISKFRGKIVCKISYLYDGIRYEVQPECDKNDFKDAKWIPEGRIKLIKKNDEVEESEPRYGGFRPKLE